MDQKADAGSCSADLNMMFLMLTIENLSAALKGPKEWTGSCAECQAQNEHVQQLGVTKQTVSSRLKQMGKVQQERWVHKNGVRRTKMTVLKRV